MDSLFKKVLYAGVGVVSTATEQLEKQINEWVEKGKLTEDEGKKVVDDLVSDTEAKKDEYEGKVRDYIEKFLARFDFPTRDEVTQLHSKVAELEAKLTTKGKEAVEQVADAAKDAVENAKDVAQDAVEKVTDAANAAKEAIAPIAPKADEKEA